MKLVFPETLKTNIFYKTYLPVLLRFAEIRNDNILIIEFYETEYISPSVICDFLSAINIIKKKKPNGEIVLLFGWNISLISYLNNTDFFLMADVNRTVSTDVIDFSISDHQYSSYSHSSKRKEHTDKTKKIILPTYCEYNYGDSQELIYHNEGEDVDKEKERISQIVQQSFYSLITRKERTISDLGIEGHYIDDLADAYSEIVANSYFHGGNNYCFFTFQNYLKTGLSFISSDTGMGYYNSIGEKIEAKKMIYSLFSFDIFQSETNKHIKSLLGIVEGILYRYFRKKEEEDGIRESKKKAFERGIMDIIRIILGVGNNENAIIRIHSDYAMLQLDAISLRKLFLIDDDIDNNRLSYEITPNLQTFKDIVTNTRLQKAWLESGHIVFYEYCFPGVHISTYIDHPQKKGEAN